MNPTRRALLFRVAAWTLGLFPLARVAYWLREGLVGLGANPIERVLHHTGWWALTLLLVTLAVSPARRLTGWNGLARTRRPLGLFAFFYATLHFGIYLGLDQLFEWSFILEDIAERPFITIGFAAWLLLLPLAITSTRGWIRRLGRSWVVLHRLIYGAAALGVVHFFWRTRADNSVPLLFAGVLGALLLLRVPRLRAWAGSWRRRKE
ncbi:MAG TPA: protein-methionine-sulfoxide reductase heme-binding subunit MsrQ [Longimicrobiales bacterium]|nr:protein-methionine-sulfoxide reductase heme-binding subunit MsrQ [Longimicrobiales bacterium]